MQYNYASIVAPGLHTIAETKSIYYCLTERHVQAIWYEKRFFKNFTTIDGESIEIISPGIWNGSAGPDFLKAHVKIGNRFYRGDVEIHLDARSWEQHDHHTDERYNDVFLHVSLWKPEQKVSIKRQDGHEILQAHFEPFLTASAQTIVQNMDLELYPYREFVSIGKCSKAFFTQIPAEESRLFFRGAADWRLKQKKFSLAANVEISENWQLIAGIAMALGYRHNAQVFLKLFTYLRTLSLNSEDEYLAIGMKIFGFFGEEYQKKWRDSPKYVQLQKLASLPLEDSMDPLMKLELNLDRVRPLNQPLRRLVVMSKMLMDSSLSSLLDRLILYWKNHWSKAQKEKKLMVLFKKLCNLVPSYEDLYWNQYYNFEEDPKKRKLILVGSDLKTRVVVNIFLPLIREKITEEVDEKKAFQELYSLIPSPKNSRTRYLSHRFFGEYRDDIFNRADIAQGAYQLHHDFCLHFEASCEGCPFIERVPREDAGPEQIES